MPAADVQYVLDSSLECGHIAGDTHFYLMELSNQTNAIVDEYESDREHNRLVTAGEASHWSSLMKMGEYFENKYIEWRRNNPAEAQMASIETLRNLPHVYREMAGSCAQKMMDTGHKTLSRDAMAQLNKSFEFDATLHVMRRSLARAFHDFKGTDQQYLTTLKNIVNGRYEANRNEYNRAVAEIIAHAQDHITNLRLDDLYIDRAFNHDYRVKETKALLREKVEDQKRVIKRSVKFLTKLIGHDNTRIFISGGDIRFEGQHAIYEIRKESKLIESHGGYRALSIFHKTYPDLLLCQMCITTPNVPLLDHVANLVMHIRSGNEDEILNIGNASQIHEMAYDLPWLEPYLPKRRKSGEQAIGLMQLMGVRTAAAIRRDEKEKIRLQKIITSHMFEVVLEDYLPLVRRVGWKNRWDELQVLPDALTAYNRPTAQAVLEVRRSADNHALKREQAGLPCLV